MRCLSANRDQKNNAARNRRVLLATGRAARKRFGSLGVEGRDSYRKSETESEVGVGVSEMGGGVGLRGNGRIL